MAPFSRLIRFLTTNSDEIYYGDAILAPHSTDIRHATSAYLMTGTIFTPSFRRTATILAVAKLLSPLPASLIPTIRCLGLNYAQHAAETHSPLPTTPVVFYKPSTSATGPTAAIPVPLLAQQTPGLDYECELVAIVGRDARDVAEADALSYLLGYAVGNDVSHRELQLGAASGGQWSLGKGFDGWAPFGPGIVSTEVMGDPQRREMGTRVNGEERQRSGTADMVFGVARTVSLLSRGTTLKAGDLVWTGTPAGVGMGRDPKAWLRDGDVVEVWLEGVGSCVNRVEFEREKEKGMEKARL